MKQMTPPEEGLRDTFALKAPYKQFRRVVWGDCDPAGIIYTPQVFHYGMEALEAFYREILGIAWIDLINELGMGSPTVRIECDFIRSLTPDTELNVEVRVERVGNASITYMLDGIGLDGFHYFKIKSVACIVKKDGMQAITIPDRFRERLLAYQAACGDA